MIYLSRAWVANWPWVYITPRKVAITARCLEANLEPQNSLPCQNIMVLVSTA